jgi:putative nucleotidyltransferase with HDIG domain
MLPIPLLLYQTLRGALGRVEDELRHLLDMKRMYHATVEAFATAVDAKDQVTAGHTRRVQAYCAALAREFGITDEGTLRALEAAALLHDVGKIGIPEHILNKPGKLTPEEYEVMKGHVGIGAEILSGIEFPFPVVPIVRAHHENWDGTGYPAGLRGEEIPLAARILTVVDCFDALTSDRPYRSAMSIAEAFDILRDRRGTMYDPRVVDTLIALQPQLGVTGPDVEAARPDPRSTAATPVRSIPAQR